MLTFKSKKIESLELRIAELEDTRRELASALSETQHELSLTRFDLRKCEIEKDNIMRVLCMERGEKYTGKHENYENRYSTAMCYVNNKYHAHMTKWHAKFTSDELGTMFAQMMKEATENGYNVEFIKLNVRNIKQ